MNIRSITIITALGVASLISTAAAQQAEDLPNAFKVDQQHARNVAYKQRLRESKANRRYNAHHSAADKRTARRVRIASRPVIRTAGYDPFQSTFKSLLNGEQFETLQGTYARNFNGSSRSRDEPDVLLFTGGTDLTSG